MELPWSDPDRHERAPRTGRFLSLSGRATHVLTVGEGEPIVLLHGNGSLGEEILSAFPDVRGVCWIAPDRPGFGRSEPLAGGRHDPLFQAIWLDRLLAAMGIRRATIVAHSLAAGIAIAFARTYAARTRRVVLLAPFCRPTPERWMPGMRLASAPLVGPVIRRVLVPPLVRHMRRSILSGFMAPNRTPPWLESFPVTHAARPGAVEAMASELKSFNAGMRRIEQELHLVQPVTVVHGLSDRTADPDWHLPWLRTRTRHLHCILLRDCGHAVHHAAPDVVLRAVLHGSLRHTRAIHIPLVNDQTREVPPHAGQAVLQDQHSGYAVA